MQLVRCVIVGDESVGKTSLLQTYGTNHFPGEHVPEYQPEGVIMVMVDGTPVNISFVDPAEQEDNLRHNSYQKIDVFLIAFSIISPDSFENVKLKWWPEIQQHAPGVPLILVGTKSDLRNDQNIINQMNTKGIEIVSTTEANGRAEEIGAQKYLECSALTKEGMKDVFNEAIREVLDIRGVLKKPKSNAGSGGCTLL